MRQEFDARWRTVIAEVVVEGQATGEFSPVDPGEFATAFSALLDGLAVQIALDDPAVDPETACRISMGFAAATLGFRWVPPELAGTAAGSAFTES